MGVWDKTTPAGSDNVRQGDDRIREAKDALEEALSHEDSTFPGATPGSTPIFIPGFLRGATGSRPTGDSLVNGRFYCNTTLGIIERYNGSSWVSVATDIPSGTVMLFYQASAPTGWTAVSVNDKFLRCVTAGGTGGSTGGSGLTPSSSLILAHTHTGPAHTHELSYDSIDSGAVQTSTLIGSSNSDNQLLHDIAGGSGTTTRHWRSSTQTGGTGNTGSSLSNTQFQYADCIICQKD